EQVRQRLEKQLQRRARGLGDELKKIEAGAAAPQGGGERARGRESGRATANAGRGGRPGGGGEGATCAPTGGQGRGTPPPPAPPFRKFLGRPPRYAQPITKSTTQQPRVCGPGPRQWCRMSSLSQSASSSASARTGIAEKSRSSYICRAIDTTVRVRQDGSS